MGRCLDYLFIPVTGPLGSGEYFRAATLMASLQASQPGCHIACCLHREARVPRLPGIEYIDIDRSPTRETPLITALIRARTPRVVIFDSTSRQTQLRGARRAGARVVYISSRLGNRRTGFQLRKLRCIDEHWIIAPPEQHHLHRGERLRLALSGRRTVTRFATTIMPSPDADRGHALRLRLGLPAAEPFVLFAPGGGSGRVAGTPIADIFAAAAQRFADDSRMATLFVAGPQAAATPAGRGTLHVTHWVSPLEMADLLAAATLVVSGGGALLLQAYECSRRIVACPAGSSDQPARIRRLAAAAGSGVRYADSTVEALHASALGALHDPPPEHGSGGAAADPFTAALAALHIRSSGGPASPA